MLRGNVFLQSGYIHQALRQIGAEVDHLEGANNGIQSGKFQSESGQIDLLHLDGGVAGHGRQKRL